MHLIGSFGRSFKVAAVTVGLLTLSCPQAWSAAKPTKLFTETWVDTNQCVKKKTSGTVFNVCNEVSGGKFTLKTTISSSSSEASGTISQSLINSINTFSIFLGNYTFSDTLADAKVVTGKSQSTATFKLVTQKCNNLGAACNPKFQYEEIVLTITKKGLFTISITATTGADFNGDTFENSIDAASFDGDPTGPVTDDLFLEIDLGSFSFNSADSNNVPVTGKVKTKNLTVRGTSTGVNLSNISITGTLQQ